MSESFIHPAKLDRLVQMSGMHQKLEPSPSVGRAMPSKGTRYISKLAR